MVNLSKSTKKVKWFPAHFSDTGYAHARCKEDGSTLNWLSPDHFDKIHQFPAGIEIYPFTGRVQIGHAPVSLALNPYQDQTSLNWPVGLAGFRV
jgi:hypothetical protein